MRRHCIYRWKHVIGYIKVPRPARGILMTFFVYLIIMVSNTSCPYCHQPLSLTSHYCSSCGRKISYSPLSTSTPAQIFLYLKTLIFPPLGFILGKRYLRQGDSKSVFIGLIAIFIAFVEITTLSLLTIHYINTAAAELHQQLRNSTFSVLF